MDTNIQNRRYGWKSQIPLCLMWGVTSHKSQGLTPTSVIIHCTKEFVPGLLYVAMTRVKSADQLKDINFQEHQLFAQVTKCVNITSEGHKEVPQCGLACCHNNFLSEED